MSNEQQVWQSGEQKPRGYHWNPPELREPTRVLHRSSAYSTDMPLPWIGGVCAGIASMLGVSAGISRFAFVAALPAFAVPLFVYLWLWLTLPDLSLIHILAGCNCSSASPWRGTTTW